MTLRMPRSVYQHPLIQRIRATIKRELRLAPNDSILVALSGGADSVALLRALLFLGFPVSAAHCNFHLRGEESNRDEAFVEALCNELQVPLSKADFDTVAYAKEHALSVEEAARNLRYDFFEKCRQKYQLHYVAVAHHLEDNFETLIGNLAKGCGIKGVRGIPIQRERIIRPLLEVPHQEIISFLNLLEQPFCTDSTNSDTAIRRNYIRHDIRPLFDHLNPSFSEALIRTFANLRECDALISYALEEQIKAVTLSQEGNLYDARLIATSPAPLSLLFAILNPLGFTRIRIAPFAEQLLNPEPAVIESATHRVRRQGGKLYIEEKSSPNEKQLDK